MSTKYIFTPLFQRELLATLLQDPSAYTRFPTLWDPSHFEDNNHRAIAHAFLRVRHYGEHPNEASLTQAIVKGTADFNAYRALPETNVLTTDQVAILKELSALLQMRVSNPQFTLNEYQSGFNIRR